MTIEEAICEWEQKNRRMGCVSATNWFCGRVPGFFPLRKTYYTSTGEVYQHVVAFNGVVEIDIAPENNRPRTLSSQV